MTNEQVASKDPLGDRMKRYEKKHSSKLDSSKPAYVRIDGRGFSKFTKKLVQRGYIIKPRDVTFESVFAAATVDIMHEFNFSLAFHQSDEISLFFAPLENERSQYPFDGKVQKLTSVIASYYTSAFVQNFYNIYGSLPGSLSFDARVAEFPNQAEAVNMLVWRYKDARRNIIQDYAHAAFSDKQLFKKSANEKWEMIGKPDLKPGNFIKRVAVTEGEVVRHHVVPVITDFDSLSWEERVALVYGR